MEEIVETKRKRGQVSVVQYDRHSYDALAETSNSAQTLADIALESAEKVYIEKFGKAPNSRDINLYNIAFNHLEDMRMALRSARIEIVRRAWESGAVQQAGYESLSDWIIEMLEERMNFSRAKSVASTMNRLINALPYLEARYGEEVLVLVRAQPSKAQKCIKIPTMASRTANRIIEDAERLAKAMSPDEAISVIEDARDDARRLRESAWDTYVELLDPKYTTAEAERLATEAGKEIRGIKRPQDVFTDAYKIMLGQDTNSHVFLLVTNNSQIVMTMGRHDPQLVDVTTMFDVLARMAPKAARDWATRFLDRR